MSSEIMSALTEIKVAVGKIETKQDNIIETITHHRKEVKDHIEKDEINTKAVGLELTNLEEKIDENHNWVKNMTLPAYGGVAVIVFLINHFWK